MIELGWDAEAPRFHVTVSGEKATLDLDLVPFRPKRLIIDVDQAGSRSQVEIPADDAVGPQGPYGEFVAALHGGPPPATRLAKVEGILRATIAWIDATRSRARNEWS
jgi:predicted dehydrogenase